MATKLSKNFTLEELTKSATAKRKGIDNEPNEDALVDLKRLAKEVLQPVRDKYGKPIIVTSGYRGEKLNKAIGGSKTSQHMLGQAADIEALDGNNAELFKIIKSMMEDGKLMVGQLIWEYGTKKQPNWVHVSLPRKDRMNNQILYYFDK